MSIKNFIDENYKHFNAAVVKDAAVGWIDHLDKGNKMFFTMAGAMSTAELGISLAQMIRQDKIHAICCTGANLEEDIFNLVAHKSYKRVPGYRYFTKEDEMELLKGHYNRVTDTCIPEDEAMRKIENKISHYWGKADKEGKSYFPYEYMYMMIKNGDLKEDYEIDPKNSWMIAACEKNIPIWTPGWEDSTLGNVAVAGYKVGDYKSLRFVKSGLEQMDFLIDWYLENTKENSVGFFQIGGGIAGDFPICVVPLLRQDLKNQCKLWSYFCQISDSTTSYGSYSGAVPNEKITWEKLGVETPSFVIESDASIVAPLIFKYVLGE